MTVSSPGHPATDDPQASLRTELLGKLVAAQMALQKAIGALIRSGASTSAADAQLSYLAGLHTSIGTASATELAAMSGEVATAVAQSKTFTEQAREQATVATAGSAVALAEAASASRVAVNDAMEAARHFQLTFASAADEAAYHDREDARRRYIAEQNAKGTPTGNLNASGAALGQLVDAKAHGAHGPAFDKQWNALVTTTEKLREQVRASGGSAKEFDDHLRNDLRQIMKSKGLTDAEIDARFAANPDPLEAARAYVQGNDEIDKVQVMAQNAREAGYAPSTPDATTPAPDKRMNDVLAKLGSSGVSPSQVANGEDIAHGLSTKIAVASTGRAQNG